MLFIYVKPKYEFSLKQSRTQIKTQKQYRNNQTNKHNTKFTWFDQIDLHQPEELFNLPLSQSQNQLQA